MNTSNQDQDRRTFLKQTALVGAGLVLAPSFLSAQGTGGNTGNIKSIGYAGKNAKSGLAPWNFERKPVGDNDVLVEIKYSSICHSDIHTIEGHWGDQPYPLVPGHEITGIVAAVGKNQGRR